MPFHNFVTETKARVEVKKGVPMLGMEKLLGEALRYLEHGQIMSTKADICGLSIELVTNSQHQHEFWLQNWFPAPKEGHPHARVYSIVGAPSVEPQAYYCPELSASLLLNTEYYGQCKSCALGMAGAILEKRLNTLSMHAALASYEGKGIVIVAPTGTGKSVQVFKLFLNKEGRIAGDDWAYITFPERIDRARPPLLIARQPERSLYLRTETVGERPWLRSLFDKCSLENVVEDKKGCEFAEGSEGCELTGQACVFDQGEDHHCFLSFPNARAIVPRESILGPEKVVDEVEVRLLVLLRRDGRSPAEAWLDPDEAIEVFRRGEHQVMPGAGPMEEWGKTAYEPWYNPYLLEVDDERQERYFRLILEDWKVPCVAFNTGVQKVQETHEGLLEALKRA